MSPQKRPSISQCEVIGPAPCKKITPGSRRKAPHRTRRDAKEELPASHSEVTLASLAAAKTSVGLVGRRQPFPQIPGPARHAAARVRGVRRGSRLDEHFEARRRRPRWEGLAVVAAQWHGRWRARLVEDLESGRRSTRSQRGGRPARPRRRRRWLGLVDDVEARRRCGRQRERQRRWWLGHVDNLEARRRRGWPRWPRWRRRGQ